MEKLELKHIAPYLPYELQFKDPETVVPGVMVAIVAGMPGLLFYEEKDEIEYFDLYAVKPLLVPLSELSLEKFANIIQQMTGWKEIIYAKVGYYWAVCEKVNEDDDEPLNDDRIEYINRVEECDYDNVISMRAFRPNQVIDLDLAYGTSDEMRYFMPYKVTLAWYSFLYKNHYDLHGLIDAGLALNKLEYIK